MNYNISKIPLQLQRNISRNLSLIAAFMLTAVAGCASNSSSPAADALSAAGTDTAPFNEVAYRISPEDVLDISVWRETELKREVTVQPDGGISFPLIGNAVAAGKTTAELESDMAKALSEYVPDAEVNIAIVKINGLKVFVTGKVTRPGQYLVGQYVDVLQALTLAGGLTPFADGKNIKILRRGNGQNRVFKFNYTQVGRGSALEQNILLQPGDTVVVP